MITIRLGEGLLDAGGSSSHVCLLLVHYPQPGKEDLWVQKMRHFDEVIRKQPGVLFVSDIFPDPAKGTLTGFTFWESEDAWKAV